MLKTELLKRHKDNGSIWISYSPDLVYWGNSQPDMERG